MRHVFSRLRTLVLALAVVGVSATMMATSAEAAMPSRNGVVSSVVAKPGSRGPAVKTIQGNLIVLGLLASGKDDGTYAASTTAAVKAFQSKYKLRVTGIVTSRDNYLLRTKADAVRKTHTLDSRCYVGRVVCVNRTTKKMYWMINGKVIKSYDVRTGRPGYATRLAAKPIYYKTTNSWSSLYHVWMPYSQYFDGGEAIHYSADFAANGYGLGSHGCVNMKSKTDAAWLYSQTRVGDMVVVYA